MTENTSEVSQELKDSLKRLMNKRKEVAVALEIKIRELEALLPKEVFDFYNDFYFAGGCIYSIWNNKEPKDYDIFCKNKKAINKLTKHFKNNKDKADIITSNAITMKEFQFVIKHIGEPEVEVARFDFKHNCFYYDGTVLGTTTHHDCLDSNKLEFNSKRARDVLNIITRIPKFLERGMEITQSEILNILELGTRPTKIFGERSAIKKRHAGKYRY